MMAFTVYLMVAGTLFVLLYVFLPRLHAVFSRRGRLIRQTLQSEPGKIINTQHGMVGPFRKLQDWLYQAGYQKPTAWQYYLLAQVGIGTIGFWLALLSGRPLLTAFATGMACGALFHQGMALRIRRNQKAFEHSLYKIYRFLNLQISAGIKVEDAIRGIPETLQDPRVRPAFLRFAASYELTFDLDQAITEIRRVWPGSDCELLASHLRQILQTGQAGKAILRMEELLFCRYFSQLQNATRQYRQKLLWLSLLALLPVMLFILYPLFHTTGQAIQSLIV